MVTGIERLYNFKDTIKNTSYDSKNNVYVSESQVEVISFDEFKRIYCNNLGKSEELLNSVDAVFIKDDKVIFIEFKNGDISSKNIKYKIKDSILICSDVLDLSVRKFRDNAIAILVYNVDKYPADHQMEKRGLKYIQGKIYGKSNGELVRFGLDMYKGMFLKEIHTYTKEEFDDYVKTYLV